eukprot:TRINITY_DN52831_c0_g1_i1.p1 TRINITY_DN52831_c0_g1~~TRINITY_DN52831_c0_g1_i1.p1  ORF type:complete len:321 (+),score=6.83 TRINITY_DN52831_c0_g1_i1:44-1006(+)
MIVRVRTQLGTWRINNVKANDTFGTLRERVETEHKTDLEGHSFSLDAGGKQIVPDVVTIKEAKLQNGSMIYVTVNEDRTIFTTPTNTMITKEGNLVTKEVESSPDGFRPGLLPLRSMKMHWTLGEFVEMDSKFEYKMKRQEKGECKQVSLDVKCITEFQNYMRTLDYRQIRVAYLYGTVKSDNTVIVEAIYEPPQNSTDIYFELLPEAEAESERVDTIAEYLNLKRVGCLISHPPREEGFYFSGYEVLFATEQQLISCNGYDKQDTFVTVKMTVDEKSNVIVEGFQFSLQCMEMVAENVIVPSNNLGKCTVQPTFTAIQV